MERDRGIFLTVKDLMRLIDHATQFGQPLVYDKTFLKKKSTSI